MHLDLTTELFDHRKKPITNPSGLTRADIEALKAAGKEPPTYTLGEALLTAVIEVPDEGNDQETKLKRWRLGQKLLDATSIDLPAEDITFIKGLVNKAWTSPIMVGVVLDLIDPLPEAAVDKPKKAK